MVRRAGISSLSNTSVLCRSTTLLLLAGTASVVAAGASAGDVYLMSVLPWCSDTQVLEEYRTHKVAA